MKDDLLYWLALNRVRGLEEFDLRGILERFGGPQGVFSEKRASLEAFSAVFAEKVTAFKDWAWAEKEMALIEKTGVKVAAFNSPSYPERLKNTWSPPCLLYMKGRDWDEFRPPVAIIGTRNPTHYGVRMAELLGRGLAQAGVSVVSGLARGCDTAGHRGALAANGYTVAVLGTGVDTVYPKENVKLYDEIVEKGTVVSEFPLSTPPLPQNFLMRNRIISGLSAAVVVVEAPMRSGALMTARLALENNREVMAVPGQATSLKSQGANRLIKDGALLVECAEDILQALSIPFASEFKEDGSEEPATEEGLVLSKINDEPLHIDGITEQTGLAITRVCSILLVLELKGAVKQLPGKRFLRN